MRQRLGHSFENNSYCEQFFSFCFFSYRMFFHVPVIYVLTVIFSALGKAPFSFNCLGFVVNFGLEPTLLQTPRGQVSVAGFDFALANLLAYANEESMADQNLTVVTAIIAGVFLLIQVAIFMICLSRVSQVKNEELKASLKLNLLDNEENLFDLDFTLDLGGTVLSLILLLVLDVKQDALIGAYTSTLFGILFVAALKIFVVRPYRNHLLVKQAEE